MSDTAANILKILTISAEFAAIARANHLAAMKLAREAGIKAEDIKAATVKWTQQLEDPLTINNSTDIGHGDVE